MAFQSIGALRRDLTGEAQPSLTCDTCSGQGERPENQAVGQRMKRKVYKELCRINKGYEQVRRSLKALARHPALHAEDSSLPAAAVDNPKCEFATPGTCPRRQLELTLA